MSQTWREDEEDGHLTDFDNREEATASTTYEKAFELETTQTDVVGVQPRTGRLCSGCLKPTRTSSLSIHRAPVTPSQRGY